jgi:hypothetical protein
VNRRYEPAVPVNLLTVTADERTEQKGTQEKHGYMRTEATQERKNRKFTRCRPITVEDLFVFG